MKILELFNRIWAKREQIRNISNIVIRIIDSIDGVKDWELKNPVNAQKEQQNKNRK